MPNAKPNPEHPVKFRVYACIALVSTIIAAPMTFLFIFFLLVTPFSLAAMPSPLTNFIFTWLIFTAISVGLWIYLLRNERSKQDAFIHTVARVSVIFVIIIMLLSALILYGCATHSNSSLFS